MHKIKNNCPSSIGTKKKVRRNDGFVKKVIIAIYAQKILKYCNTEAYMRICISPIVTNIYTEWNNGQIFFGKGIGNILAFFAYPLQIKAMYHWIWSTILEQVMETFTYDNTKSESWNIAIDILGLKYCAFIFVYLYSWILICNKGLSKELNPLSHYSCGIR